MKFPEFIGNEQIRDAMAGAVKAGRVANAYLFAGPWGVGKRTLALIAATALLCEEGSGEPCGECGSCRRAEAAAAGDGFHPDLGIIGLEDKSKFIRVEQVRQDLVRATQMRPHGGGRQVFVIDPADALHPSAANAFLKTLEEAPGSSTFFLISANPSALLPTVLSRCQRFNFQPVARDRLADELVRRGLRDSEEAKVVAALSGGAVGRALSFDLETHLQERKLALNFVQLSIGSGEMEEVFRLASKFHDESDRFEGRLQIIASIYRDLMLTASAGSAAEVVNADIQRELLDTAQGRSPRKLARLLSLLAEMREPMVRNVRIDSICERIMLEGRDLFSGKAG